MRSHDFCSLYSSFCIEEWAARHLGPSPKQSQLTDRSLVDVSEVVELHDPRTDPGLNRWTALARPAVLLVYALLLTIAGSSRRSAFVSASFITDLRTQPNQSVIPRP